MTEIVLSLILETNMREPSGLQVTAVGLLPTGMVIVTCHVAVSMTEIVRAVRLQTKMRDPSRLLAIPRGIKTEMVSITNRLLVSITATLLSL